jgi:hypothetical protein
MELQPDGAEMATPAIWFLAQVNHSATKGWQSLGIASDRAAAARMAASGYAMAAKAGHRPWGTRLVVSGSLKALD